MAMSAPNSLGGRSNVRASKSVAQQTKVPAIATSFFFAAITTVPTVGMGVFGHSAEICDVPVAVGVLKEYPGDVSAREVALVHVDHFDAESQR
ncbi:hypothetical protein MTP99_016771 [Tenebrio molitor]|nr:hypothetical protein MTP99_016771 [Tenebrio molitor]